MMDLSLRILLTLTLAIISPAWCCCTVRAIADEHAGIVPAGCAYIASDRDDDRAAGNAVSQETGDAPQRGCCSRGLIPAAAGYSGDEPGDDPENAPGHPRGAGPCCDPGESEETSECKCDQRSSDLNRAEAAAPDLTLRGLSSSTAVVAIIGEPARSTRPQLLNRPHAPPRLAFTLDPTLRSLRTLFLI